MYDKNIMDIALNISKCSKDPSAQVCAIITNSESEILSVGVNKLKEYLLIDDLDYIYKNKSIKKYAYDHAEIVALKRLKPTDEKLNIYITYPSCLQCTVELLLNSNYHFENIYYIERGSDTFKARYQIDEALKLINYKKINCEAKLLKEFEFS